MPELAPVTWAFCPFNISLFIRAPPSTPLPVRNVDPRWRFANPVAGRRCPFRRSDRHACSPVAALARIPHGGSWPRTVHGLGVRLCHPHLPPCLAGGVLSRRDR